MGFMSLVLVGTASMRILYKSNKLLIVLMMFEYGMTLYGLAFIIVAFFPSKKSSATVASIVHILSYYFGIRNKGYSTSMMTKSIVSLVPNASLCFMIEHLLHCEYQGKGMQIEEAFMNVRNYTFV